MSITVVLMQMVKLFLVMCLGFVLYKVGIIDNHTKQQVTKFVLYVTTPALIIHSFVQNLGADGSSGMLGILFAVAIGMYVLLPMVALVFNKILMVNKKDRGIYMFMTVFSNVGFMGFPVVEALYGAQGLFYAAIFNCVFNIFVFTGGVLMVNYGRTDSATSVKDVLNVKKLFNPAVICCILAVIIFVVGIPLPEVIMDVLGSVGGLTSSLAMILVGASLAVMDIKEMFGDIRIYIYTLLRQFGLPLLAWPVIDMLIENEKLAVVTLIMVAMPIANTSVLFATEYKADEKLAARAVFMTTLTALISIPFVMWICL